MFCQYCGKQIADDARFCNYCGKQVKTVGSGTASSQTATQQKAAPAKSGGFGKTLMTIVLCAAVFLAVKYIAENVAEKKANEAANSNPEPTISLNSNSGSSFEQGLQDIEMPNAEIQDAMDSCARGAIYEEGFLRYGLTKLYMPGYTLLPGEGDDRDWLVSPTGGSVVAAYHQPEIVDVSFDASDGEGMLNSYLANYSDAAMMDFQKYEVNGYPVIRYIVRYTADDVTQYHGELIVFPCETTDETIRLAVFEDVASGYGMEEINAVFNTLAVSHEFRVSGDETTVMGANRITVK